MPTDRIDETSAGGLAVRLDGEVYVAVIIGRRSRRRRGRTVDGLRWSLPKGHVESGETLAETAVREVAEETGIEARVRRRLGIVRYTFTSAGRRIHKQVHHFLLDAIGGELSDADVEVAAVRWASLGELPDLLEFPAERRLVRKAAAILAGGA